MTNTQMWLLYLSGALIFISGLIGRKDSKLRGHSQWSFHALRYTAFDILSMAILLWPKRYYDSMGGDMSVPITLAVSMLGLVCTTGGLLYIVNNTDEGELEGIEVV